MKLIVFGANGRQGSRLVSEALARGHEVTATVHDADRAENVDPPAQVVVADASDPASIAAAAAGHDAALLATGGGGHAEIARAMLSGLSQADVRRLVVVGGAGSLEVPSGGRLVDTPDFHEEWKPEALGQAEALDVYRGADTDVDWTYVSPGAMLAPGERTGRYRTAADELLVGDNGQSEISMEDFALALLDELEQGQHVRRRFTAAW